MSNRICGRPQVPVANRCAYVQARLVNPARSACQPALLSPCVHARIRPDAKRAAVPKSPLRTLFALRDLGHQCRAVDRELNDCQSARVSLGTTLAPLGLLAITPQKAHRG